MGRRVPARLPPVYEPGRVASAGTRAPDGTSRRYAAGVVLTRTEDHSPDSGTLALSV